MKRLALLAALLLLAPNYAYSAVPTAVTDLSTSAASNSPAGSESIGTSLDDYIRAGFAFTRQAWDANEVWCGTSAGTNTVTCTASAPIPTAYKTGQAYRFIAGGANTGAATLNVSSLGAKDIKKNGTTALASGDIPIGSVVEVVYDGTNMQLMNVFINTSSFATLASPTFTGTPAAPTAAVGTSTTQVATTAFVVAEHKSKIVPSSRDTATASGNQSITGAGFTPRGFRVLMAGNSEGGRWSDGVYDGTTQVVNYRNVATGNYGTSSSYVILVQDAAGTTQYLGAVSSLDADGCTIAWTKVGSPTGTINIYFEFYR